MIESVYSISDIMDIQNGYAFDSNCFNTAGIGLPLIRVRDVIRGYSETYTTEKCPPEYIVHSGDVLIGMDGEFNIAEWKSSKALLNQRVCKILPNGKADKNYLKYKLAIILKKIEDETPFVTVKHLSSEKLKKEQIVLPPLFEQRRIAGILDQADRLHRLRHHARHQTNSFLQSVFLKMFGDPSSNPMNWEKKKIDEIKANTPYSLIGGPFGSDLVSSDYTSAGIPVIRGTNLSVGMINDIDADFVYVSRQKAKQLSRNRAFPNDIIFTQRGTLGQVAWIHPTCPTLEFIISQSQMKLTCNENLVLPAFVFALFKMPTMVKMIEDSALITGVPHTNLQILKDYEIIVPPLTKQKEFVQVMRCIEKVSLQQQEADRQAKINFLALLHQAFSGELIRKVATA